MGETPALEGFPLGGFAVEVEAFLAARYPRRTKAAAEPFVWGQAATRSGSSRSQIPTDPGVDLLTT